MPDITLVPTDILRRIIMLSCTDGGNTGRSLSETCRFLYAQSHDTRFYSLSISSLKQLQDFLKSIRPLAPAGAHNHLPVHHLWLSFRGADDRDVLASSSPHNFSWSCVPGTTADDEERLRADLARAQALVERWPSHCAAAIHELLPLVAPTLRTLCVLQGDQQPLPAFFQHLPHLRELTIYNGLAGIHRRAMLGPSVARADDTLDWANALRMPTLERLHLVAHGSTRAAFLRRSPLRNAHLTHLRVSNIGQSDTAIPGRRPYEQCGRPLPGAPSAIPADATFPRLRELVLHGIEVRPGGFCGTNAAEYQEVRWCLEEIVATLNLMEGVRAIYLSSKEGFSGCSAGRLWDDWLDRIDGGPGCWVESQEEEERLEKVVTVREEHEEHEELCQLQEFQRQLAVNDEEVILANGCGCEDHPEHYDEGRSITSTETSWGCNIV